MAAIERLVGLVCPPSEPVAAEGEWSTIEAQLGLELPSDFKEFTARYGAGTFCNFLHPLWPFFAECSMASQAEGILRAGRTMRAEFPDEYSYPYHPDEGGLFPWATSDNGDRLYWLTRGEPSTWQVIVWGSRGPDHEVYPCGAVAFLAGYLKGNLACALFPDDVVGAAGAFFDPHRVLTHVELRLSQSVRPFERCAAIVRGLLAPTEDRGRAQFDGEIQEHFLATPSKWKVTYENMYGHRLRLGFPPDDESLVQQKVNAITQALGVQLLDPWKPA